MAPRPCVVLASVIEEPPAIEALKAVAHRSQRWEKSHARINEAKSVRMKSLDVVRVHITTDSCYGSSRIPEPPGHSMRWVWHPRGPGPADPDGRRGEGRIRRDAGAWRTRTAGRPAGPDHRYVSLGPRSELAPQIAWPRREPAWRRSVGAIRLRPPWPRHTPDHPTIPRRERLCHTPQTAPIA